MSTRTSAGTPSKLTEKAGSDSGKGDGAEMAAMEGVVEEDGGRMMELEPVAGVGGDGEGEWESMLVEGEKG